MRNFISRLVRGATVEAVSEQQKKIDAITVQLDQQRRVHQKVIDKITAQTKIIKAVTNDMIPEIWREIDGLKSEVSKLKTGKHKKWRQSSETMEALVYKNLDGDNREL